MKRFILVLIAVAVMGLGPAVPAAALTAKDMARFLPAELAGFKAPNPVMANDLKVSGMAISSAARVYLKGRVKVKIDLTSSPMVKNLAKVAAMKSSVNSAHTRLKSYAVAGFNAMETYHKGLKLLAVQVFVSDLVMVVARLESPDPGPALTLIKALDLKGLSRLK
jgi:hypothetical protein